MNFQDIVSNNNEQMQTLKEMEVFITEVTEAKEQGDNIYSMLFINVYKGNGSSIQSTTMNQYQVFREKLIAIDAYALGITIVKFKNIYNNLILGNLLDEIEKEYKQIARIRKIIAPDEVVKEYIACINSLNSIIINYNKMKTLIYYINSVSIDLSQGIEKAPLQVRFYNESNTVSSLIENVTVIRNIYNNVNELIGDGKELRYCRAESGTFQINLTGCVTALMAMIPLLEFSYKVYSEQLSPKAKQEVKGAEIKLRRDYLKLLKEATEIKTIEGFNIKDRDGILATIADLDTNIKELYSKNPYIKVDDKNLGTEEMKDKRIPIELLSSADDITSLDDLVN